MKKILVTTLSLGIFAWAGSALAAPMTWTDVVDFDPDVYVGWFKSFDYTLDITNDGFDPNTDTVETYNLTVALYDDYDYRWEGTTELAYISQPGILGDGFYNWNFTSNDFGYSLAGLYSLNTTGSLSVSITSWWGDFYLDSSSLTAYGQTSQVPEPATMLLFGAGLAGIAAIGRRRKAE